MKYKSDILETIHESATEKFQLGFISETRMREYDEMCLSPDALQDTAAQGDIAKHADLVTA
jgi:DNA-binding transcriptional regulator YiaG